MSMHKVHFVNGESTVFYSVITTEELGCFKGYADSRNTRSVCIPFNSVLYVEEL